jgi:hypothetical protein
MAPLHEKKLGQKISCYGPFQHYKVNGSETEKLEVKRCKTKKGLKRKHAKFNFYFSQTEAKNEQNESCFASGCEIMKRKKKRNRHTLLPPTTPAWHLPPPSLSQ